jgi:predicted hotdog family 3-hydroxylacyl-ACP dehydratase
MTAPLPKHEIAGLIPHAGAMCLLDSVLSWDAGTIRCAASSHRDPANPLAREGRLAAVCGVEYAAQAMALHGRLAGAVGERPRVGFLASVREMACRVAHLNDLPGDLLVEAEQLMGSDERVIYRFALACGGAEIVSGRAAVVLQA